MVETRNISSLFSPAIRPRKKLHQILTIQEVNISNILIHTRLDSFIIML